MIRALRSIFEIVRSIGRTIQRSDFLFDKYVLAMIAAGAVANVAAWYYFGYTLAQPSDAFVTLHFTVATGADLIGEASSLYDGPFFVAIISLVNVAIARALYNYDTLLAYVTISMLSLINIAMLYNSVLLVSVNA